MKNTFLILILFSGSILCNGQYYKPRKDIKFNGFIGLGLGQEHILSFPKLSGLFTFDLTKKSNFYKSKMHQSNFYVGPEISMFVLFAGAFSASATAGFTTGLITTDCSITRQVLVNPSSEIVARQTTINPKIGIMLGPVWFKAGPSFRLTSEDVYGSIFGDFFRIKSIPLNLELSYNLSRTKY